MTKAVESGMPKLRIEEAAARRQAASTAARRSIVGVNKYRPTEPEHVDVLDIDNTKVREQQIARLDEGPGQPRRAACQRSSARCARARGRRQPARAVHRGRPGPGHRRRDERRHGGRVRPAPGRDP